MRRLQLAVEDGRSGGIRTHDPQSPRLMRYQAALRSDRGERSFNSLAAQPQCEVWRLAASGPHVKV